MFRSTNSVTLCQNSVLQNSGDVKNEVFEKKIAFLVFPFLCWRNRNRKKRKKKMEKAQKPCKNSFFKVVIQKCEKSKKWIFSKNWLTLVCVGKGEKRAFSCTLSVMAKIFLCPKQCKPENTIKIGVSAEIGQNQKWHLFLKKVFLTWLKNWILLTVFLKSCAFLKTLFL